MGSLPVYILAVPTWYLLSVMVSTLIAFLYHVTVGLGAPVAWQGRSTTLPTELMVIGSGEMKNSGGTAGVRERKYVVLLRLISNKFIFKCLRSILTETYKRTR